MYVSFKDTMGLLIKDIALGAGAVIAAQTTAKETFLHRGLKTAVGLTVALLAIVFGSRSIDDKDNRRARPMFSAGFQSLFHVLLGAFAVRHPLILITSMFIQFYGRSQPDPDDPDVFVSLYEYMFGFALMYAIPRRMLPTWMQLLPASWSTRIYRAECRS